MDNSTFQLQIQVAELLKQVLELQRQFAEIRSLLNQPTTGYGQDLGQPSNYEEINSIKQQLSNRSLTLEDKLQLQSLLDELMCKGTMG